MGATMINVTRLMRLLLVAALLLSALLTACGADQPAAIGEEGTVVVGDSTVGANHHHPMADLDAMPYDVRSAPERTQEAYRFAVANPEAASRVPCYCGCVGLGHLSSYDCYVAEVKDDGKLAFDSHAVGCTICVDITQDQMRLMDDGLSPEEIRGYIDAHYAAFGPPTPLTADAGGEG